MTRTTNPEIIEIKTAEALERCFPVMRELRQELTFQNFIHLYERAKAQDDFRLVGIFLEGNCIAVMGYRILHDFVHGKHLYIDDLVVTESRRSSGIGAQLLLYAEEQAKLNQCQGLRLCTGIDRKDAQSFYEKNGWEPRAIAFKKTVRG